MYTKDLKIQINRVDFLNKIRKIAKKNTLDYFVFDTLKISESNSNFYFDSTYYNSHFTATKGFSQKTIQFSHRKGKFTFKNSK